MMRLGTILTVCNLVWMFGSGSVQAMTVGLAPVDYRDADTGESIENAAAQIHASAVDAIQEVGYQLVSGDAVRVAMERHARDGECLQDCLARAAGDLGVAELLHIRIQDSDQMEYRIRFVFANQSEFNDTRSGGFFVVREWLKGRLVLMMKSIPVADAPEESDDVDSTDPQQDDIGKTAALDDSTREPDLSTRPFWIAVTATATAGAITLVLDGVAHRKYRTARTNIQIDDFTDPSALQRDVDSEIRAIKRIQNVEKVFLGLTISGALVTGILALLTDFRSEEASVVSRRPLKLSAATDGRSGMMGVVGSF